MKKFKVGIVGNGFVGEAIAFAFLPSQIYGYMIKTLKKVWMI